MSLLVFGPLGFSPNGLGLITQDQIELIDVAGTCPFGVAALRTSWSTFVTLRRMDQDASGTPQFIVAVSGISCEKTHLDFPLSTELTASTGLAEIDHAC